MFLFQIFFFRVQKICAIITSGLVKKPKSILEIGVYTGKDLKKCLWLQMFSNNIEFYG